jgi:hypothetical protein
MAKKTNSAAKARAWNRFSQWVRVKGCLETTGFPFVGVCITCGKRFHITALQAGHMKGGRRNSILFHEKLTNPQCVICNETFHGKPKKYRAKLVDKYGKEQVSIWEREAAEIKKDRDMDYHAIEVKYREATNELLIPFGYNDYEELLRGHNI